MRRPNPKKIGKTYFLKKTLCLSSDSQECKKFIEFICFLIESYFIFVVLKLDSVFSPIEANSKLFVKLNSKQDEFLYEFVYFACWWR
jgi:hypothetical protein